MTRSDNVGGWESVDDLLDFAIEREQEAVGFYSGLAATAENQAMRETLAGFAREERGHKTKLETAKRDRLLVPSATAILDLKIADYLVDVELSPAMDYSEMLVVSMKREEAAQRLYTDLAAAAEEEAVRGLLLALAQEEAKHKLRFETEYDEYVLKDN